MAMLKAAVAALVTVITADTTLDPGRTYGPLEIRASGITVEGRGARIRGGGPAGVSADGVSRVTLRGLDVAGFTTGIRVRRGAGWRVERCVVTDNTADGLALDAPAHTVVRDVRATGNAGAGIAVRGDLSFRAHHLVLDANTLAGNAQGLALERADWIDCSSNVFQSNGQDVAQVGDVDHLTQHGTAAVDAGAPTALMRGPIAAVQAGRPVTFDASESVDPSGAWLAYRWDLADGTTETAAGFPHVFNRPGVYRVGLTVHGGSLADLAYREVRVVERGLEAGTAGGAIAFTPTPAGVPLATDRTVCLVGNSSVRADCPAGRVALDYPSHRALAMPFSPFLRLQLWVKPGAACQPRVVLHESATRSIALAPSADPLHPPYSEGDWVYLDVPVAGDEAWTRTGADLRTVNWISISFESPQPASVWLDGMGFSGR